MKITEDLIKGYIAYEDKEHIMKEEVNKFYCDKYKELYSDYKIIDINKFNSIQNRLENYSGAKAFFIAGLVFLIPSLIALASTLWGCKNLNMMFITDFVAFGLIILLVGIYLRIRNKKLMKLYKKLKK